VGGGEEDAEAVSRCDIRDTSLLVDEARGGSQHGAGRRCGSSGGERLLRVGSSDDISVDGCLVEDHGGGVGGDSWPTTRGFVVVVIGNGRVWEAGTVGGVGGIIRRVGGVYHSNTNGQAGRRRGRGGKPGAISALLYIRPAPVGNCMTVTLGTANTRDVCG